MAAEWYCRIAGAELGPLSSQQLRALAADGRLRPNDEVRQGRHGRWVHAARVRGLLKEPSAEVLMAQPLVQDERRAGEKPPSSPASPAASGSLRKARKAPQPPEPSAAPVPVAKAAARPSAAQPAPAQSPFVFREPETQRGKSVADKSGVLSPAEVAERRQKQRKRRMIVSAGALGGAALIGGILLFVNPFSGPAEVEKAAESRTVDEPVEELELGEFALEPDEFVPGRRHTTEAPEPAESDRSDESDQSAESDESDELADEQDDDADDEGEVYHLEVTEKPVEQALGRDDPDRPLSSLEKMKRDMPELYEEQD